ncbi:MULTISPECIES: SigB/SigF/SigG family RNA polymerase sigma factor [unclassified Streptomyces]|uniref:SigB/SigF/SigG family RNA polymerase sigma factor n=1 Tax=unclassified Streptomyces TaxID=2593676 RepID=UPI001E2BDD78|nr:SigB/SigF/SigG family RNA polymerase sigma factor [Streptomyces sp. CB02980]MCB8907004.1 SigB/SigF/SigG family RNA polymerase sigma factor [Streptomyces sp. CB02980]
MSTVRAPSAAACTVGTAAARPVGAGPSPVTGRPGTAGATLRRAATAGLPTPDRPTDVSTDDARTLSVALFRRLRELDEGTPEYAYVRNTLVELNLSMVKYAARRFRSRAEPTEDIVQVGTIGLIKAINRFDPDRAVDFSAFALPTIVGEMKRFFRDTSWAVRVPRRLQELRIDLAKAADTLEQDLGRRPTRAELAARLHVSEEDVAEGQLAAHGYAARSLDGHSDDSDAPPGATARRLAASEPSYELIESLTALRPLLARLDERDRRILELRFGEELTQREIGRRVGLSQMHVSRLLARILTELRKGLLDDGPTADGTAG